MKNNLITKIILLLTVILIFNSCTTPEQEQRYKNIQSDRKQIFDNQMRDANVKASKLSSLDIDMISVKRTLWSGGLNQTEAANGCGSRGKFYYYFPETTKLEDLRNRTQHYQKILVVYCSAKQLVVDPLYGSYPIDSGYCYCSFSQNNNSLKLTNFNASVGQSMKNNQVKTVEESKEMLVDIKNTCMKFGYKEGTETLANCMKDLYLKETQSTTTIVQGTNSTSKPKRKIDPSVWDDLLKMGGITSGSSSSSSSGSLTKPKATCYYTGEETVGHNKSCRYSCTGSIDTITIAAMENCPLHIQR